MIYLYLIILLLSIIFVLYALYLRYRKNRFTRERYAFAALSSTVLLSSIILTTIFGSTPWDKVLEFVFHLLDKEYQSSSSTWSEKLLAVIFVSYVIYLINKNFINWSGLKSIHQHENEVLFKNNTLLSEGIFELTRLIKGQEIVVFNKNKVQSKIQKIDTPIYNLAWRDEVRELIELKWASYKFNEDDDWHDINNCWIGINYKTNQKICLLCCAEEPTEQNLLQFISYCENFVLDYSIEQFIVVYKEGLDTKKISIENNDIYFYSHKYLLDTLVDFEDYFYDIKRRVLSEGLADSEIKLFDSYVESSITNPSTKKSESLEYYLFNWLKEKSFKQLSVLGEYGQGKSTGLLAFTYKVLFNIKNKSHIPILIELRGKSPSTLQPIELFGAWASPYRIDPKALFKLLQHGRLLLIFEGFDEMSQVGDSEARINHFRSIWKFCYKNSKMIITGRPNFFLDDSELKTALGIEESVGSGPHCEALHLHPFSIQQIEESLRWLDYDSRMQILELSKKDTNFYDIVSRPSLLFIVAILWKEKSNTFINENINSATVISLFINHSLRRQIEKQSDGRKFMVLTESERRFFMKGVAAYMASKNLQNQINPAEFNEAIIRLFEFIPDEIANQSSVIRNEPCKPLKERVKDNVNAIEEIQTDVRTYGLLVRDYSRMGALKFPHKSFFEYLFAEYLFDGINFSESSEHMAIYNSTRVSYDRIINWEEALDFLGELFKTSNNSNQTKSKLPSLLFRKVVNNDSFFFERLWNYIYLYDASTRMNFGKKRLFIRVWRPYLYIRIQIALLSMIGLFTPMLYAINFNKVSTTDHFSLLFSISENPFLLILFIIGLISLTFSFFNSFTAYSNIMSRKSNLRFNTGDKIALWLLLIKSIGISSEDLRKNFGKNISKALPELYSFYNLKERIKMKEDYERTKTSANNV